MSMGSTNIKYVLLMITSLACALAATQTSATRITGTVLDPAGRPVAGAQSGRGKNLFLLLIIAAPLACGIHH